jgi:lipopolysaccharide heptosyltransferase II
VIRRGLHKARRPGIPGGQADGRPAQVGQAGQPVKRVSVFSMNIDWQRSLDRWAGIPVCWLLSLMDGLWPWKRTVVTPPRVILVVLLSEAGSMVCAQPMLNGLRTRYPDTRLLVMVLERNRSFVELLGIVPASCVIGVSDHSLGALLLGTLRALRRLRAERVDTVIDCELFARISAIYSYLSGAAVRAGFHRHTQEGLYRGSFINRRVPYNPYSHIASQFMALAAAIESDSTPIGKSCLPADPPQVQPLNFDPADIARAAEALHRDFPALRKRPLVLIYGSGGLLPIRAWPLESFKSFAATLIREGYAVGTIGMSADRELCQSIVEHCASPYCANLAGYTANIRELVLLFHSAVLLVSNDGGPVHFAALTPMPVLALFGPETPVLYGPLSRRARCLFRGLPCSPCLSAYNHRRTPCDGDNQCLKQVGVAEVLEAARRLIREAEAA